MLNFCGEAVVALFHLKPWRSARMPAAVKSYIILKTFMKGKNVRLV